MATEDRVERIRRAAIAVFADQGFRATSMADLAAAAGMSRPALYQYFRNRGDVFRSALGAVLDDAADAALAELAREGGVRDRLEGYLQRAWGDLAASLAAAPRGDEIIDVKIELALDVADAVAARRRAGLSHFIAERVAEDERVELIVDLLELAPSGLKRDLPDVATFRRRLAALAESAATLITAGTPAPG